MIPDRTALALTLLLALVQPLGAQGGAAKAIVPVAVGTLAINPEAYYGELVSVTGFVERRFSASAFSIDQDRTKHTGQEVLILAPTLSGAVELDGSVTVLGELLRFDDTAIARSVHGRAPTLPPDIAATFHGRAAVLARTVLNAAAIELTDQIPAPTTAPGTQSRNRIACVFAVRASGVWKNREPHADVTPAVLSLRFEAVDPDEGTARVVGEFGESEITVRLSAGMLHFVQAFNSGSLYITTVWGNEALTGKLNAVHSRHERGDVVQYYGGCDAGG